MPVNSSLIEPDLPLSVVRTAMFFKSHHNCKSHCLLQSFSFFRIFKLILLKNINFRITWKHFNVLLRGLASSYAKGKYENVDVTLRMCTLWNTNFDILFQIYRRTQWNIYSNWVHHRINWYSAFNFQDGRLLSRIEICTKSVLHLMELDWEDRTVVQMVSFNTMRYM